MTRSAPTIAILLAISSAMVPVLASDVLVIEHTYDGTIERAGTLNGWQYSGGHMVVEFSDGGEGIFRNSFE